MYNKMYEKITGLTNLSFDIGDFLTQNRLRSFRELLCEKVDSRVIQGLQLALVTIRTKFHKPGDFVGSRINSNSVTFGR